MKSYNKCRKNTRIVALSNDTEKIENADFSQMKQGRNMQNRNQQCTKILNKENKTKTVN